MTATWTKALGFLSLPEATRSLQATESKRRREGGRDDGREQEMRAREEKKRTKIKMSGGDNSLR